MNKLRTKQRLFLQEYIKTKGNGTQAALRVYDTKSVETAATIANENIRKPEIKQELERILQHGELQLNKFTNKLSDIVASEPAKGYSGADILEAVKTGLKLHGVLSDRKVTTTLNVNANLSELSEHELRQLRAKKQQEIDSILSE